MFLFRADRLLAALEEYQPKVLQACQSALAHPNHDLDFIRLDAGAFAAAPAISIDYAVMEKTHDAVAVSYTHLDVYKRQASDISNIETCTRQRFDGCRYKRH